MEGGFFIVEFLNNYSAVYSIMIAVLIENIAVAWIYGNFWSLPIGLKNESNLKRYFFPQELRDFVTTFTR